MLERFIIRPMQSLNPKTVDTEVLAIKALELMQQKGISQLLAVDGKNYKGIVHLHNLIKEGII